MDPFQDQRALRQDASLEPQWDRHPQVAGIMLQGLKGGGEMASANVARECVVSLADAGCVLPSSLELVDGVRLRFRTGLATFRVEHRGRTAFA